MSEPAGVALTFDDGPDPHWTPRVARALEAAGVRATFFVIGEHVARHPQTVEALAAAGHDVQLHCHRHRRHTELDRAALEADTDAALATLEALGLRARLWRTPWGNTAPWTPAVAAERGLTLVGWSADTHDWRGDHAGLMLASIDADVGDGAIVLAHDGLGPGALRAGCEGTIALVPRLVALARGRGLSCGPVGLPRAASVTA